MGGGPDHYEGVFDLTEGDSPVLHSAVAKIRGSEWVVK